MVLRKSKLFSRTTRHNDRQRKDEQNEAARRETEPRLVELPSVLDELERINIAEQNLKERGIIRPQELNLKDCDYSFSQVIDAAADGMAHGTLKCREDLKHNREYKGDVLHEETPHCAWYAVAGAFKNAIKGEDRLIEQKAACESLKKSTYEQELHEYHQHLDKELYEVPTLGKKFVSVPYDNPNHPNYKPPQPAPRDGGRNYDVTIYTDGHTHGGRFQWRY